MRATAMLVGSCPRAGVATGVAAAFGLFVDGCRARGLRVEVIDRSEVVDNGSAVGAFGKRKVLMSLKLLLRFYARLLRVPSVYLTIASSAFGFVRDFLMIWPSWFFGRRIVLHLHGAGYRDFYSSQPSWFQFIVRATLARADVIIILSKALKDQFDFVPGIDKKLEVVPNAVGVDLSNIERVSKTLADAPPIRLLYFSNMIRSKGYLDVVEACRILRDDYEVEFLCDFCGAFLDVQTEKALTGEEEHFQQLISNYDLSRHVMFHGTVIGTHKVEMLKKAHILLLPTYYPWEGQPLCILEALAFGTPVVATGVKGIVDQVRDDYNGAIIKERDPHGIAKAVARIASNHNKYRMLSSNAIRHFNKKFSTEQHLNKLISLIQSST